MPSFDEASLRKAAAWQDFKEAQSLLSAGAVVSSEKTGDGWRGEVKVGARIYRTSVAARTPTWLDAKCPCPASQREGKFCPHAIAAGLHLLNAPAQQASPPPKQEKTTAANPMPAISWRIRLNGPWREHVRAGRLSASLSHSDNPPTEADDRLTAWLLTQKVVSRPPIQLALSAATLPGFLDCIEDHPAASADSGEISIESGAQIILHDCALEGETVSLTPAIQEIVRIGKSLWKISPTGVSRINCPQPHPLLASLAEGTPAEIPLDRFLGDLPVLQSHIDFTASSWFESLLFIPAIPDFLLTVTGSSSKITAALTFSYGSAPLPRLEGNTVITRNPKAEASAKSTPPLADGIFDASDPDSIRDFLTASLRNFPLSWKTELAPNIRNLASSYLFVSPKIVIISSGDDWLDFNLSYETNDGKVIPAAEIRRLLRSKGTSSARQVILSDDIENLIDPIFEDLEIHQENARYIARNASAEIIRNIRNNLQKDIIPSSLGAYQHAQIPKAITAALRPYQADGFSWLIDRLNRYHGALLADDMGLGKTLQTIACIEHLFTACSQPSPALVVVTTSLLGNWQAEFRRFAPARNVVTLHGTGRDRLREKIRPDDVILTTYGTLARDLAWHLKQEYSVAVIDEASLIRNPDTDHSKAVAKLNATRRIALTGTPVENTARDLWAIFRFIQPGWLGTRSHFKERYESPLTTPETAPRAAALLRLKTSPFVLRRTKSEVAPELPSKIAIDEFCTLSKDQTATYRDLLAAGRKRIEEIRDSGQEGAARMQTLTTLLRLRQTCCDLALLDPEKLRLLPIPRRSAKLERLLEIAEQSIASGSKLLVFSQFQKQLLEIESALTTTGITSLRLDGKTRSRQELVDRFQSDSGPPVFLISLKAGGYGLNLTAADVVIHFDPWWNPAAEAQATDRAHRIGQTKPVTVFRLLTRGTVEEKVIQLQSTKKALADSLDESGTTAGDAPAWSAAELERLLMD
ncbi:DEAD/DEAH box helicase family protein [Akkermansiaceae bacterium]|nr:DEAD/DEAH box helicase family protein [Akkermansiaceae bacterium]